jgi:hypothetical protein
MSVSSWLSRADWLRFVIPVWRFFETPDATPRAEYRRCSAEEEPGPWTPALITAPPHGSRFWFNPEANLVLAQYSALDQLVRRLEDASPVSLTLVKQWYLFLVLRRVVEARLADENGKDYQLRIARGFGAEAEELLVTDVLTCESSGTVESCEKTTV